MNDKKPPAITQKGKNVAGAMFRVAKQTLSGGRVLATDGEFQFRMTLCKSNVCGSFIESNMTCVVCGCFLDYKLSLTTEECPLGFWASIKE